MCNYYYIFLIIFNTLVTLTLNHSLFIMLPLKLKKVFFFFVQFLIFYFLIANYLSLTFLMIFITFQYIILTINVILNFIDVTLCILHSFILITK
jgi:hypothetical protein